MQSARILADSTSPYGGVRLTTMEVIAPRSVLSAICADRALSYSTAPNQGAAAWRTVIVSATEWGNFFALHTNDDTHPEIRQAAELMREVYKSGTPQLVLDDTWHLPLIQPEEFDGAFEYTEDARKISAARCASADHTMPGGEHSHEASLWLYDSLVRTGHLSPLEHVATPFTRRQGHFRQVLWETAGRLGRDNYGLEEDEVDRIVTSLEFDGNFRDWTQLRKTIPHEADFSLRPRS